MVTKSSDKTKKNKKDFNFILVILAIVLLFVVISFAFKIESRNQDIDKEFSTNEPSTETIITEKKNLTREEYNEILTSFSSENIRYSVGKLDKEGCSSFSGDEKNNCLNAISLIEKAVETKDIRDCRDSNYEVTEEMRFICMRKVTEAIK